MVTENRCTPGDWTVFETDEGFAKAEGEQWNRQATTPGMATGREAIPAVKRLVSILVYEHRHGRDVSACGSYREAEAELFEIVRDQWKDRADKAAPDDPSGLTCDEAICVYFDGRDEEFYDIEEIEVEFPV